MPIISCYTKVMKFAPATLPSLLESSSVAEMVSDGELENAQLIDEDATNANIAALELSGVLFDKVNFTGAQLGRINARDVVVKQSDLSGANLADGNCNRVEFTNCRLSGLDVSRTSVHDAVFRGCKLDMANFRYADLRRVQFIDCTLVEADFIGATLYDVSFSGCRLEQTVFEQVKAKKLDLRGSELVELSGWRALKGATIDETQLVSVAPYLAHELGLTVRSDQR